MSRGKLIVLTGMDGSGKTTQARELASFLARTGHRVEYLWCRGRNLLSLPFMVVGRRLHGAPKTHLHIRGSDDRARETSYQSRKLALLRNPLIRAAWTFAVLAERLVELSVRVPLARLRNDIVIADRYLYDSLVDLAADLNEAPVAAATCLDRWYVRLLPRPDVVALLDLPEETAFARKTDTPSIEYLGRRRAIYRSMAKHGRWHEVDAARPMGEVFADIRSAVAGTSIVKALSGCPGSEHP